MTIVFLGFSLPASHQEKLNRYDTHPHFATFNFSQSLIRCLLLTGNPLHIFSFYEIRNFPDSRKLFFGFRRVYDNNLTFNILPFVNLLLLKHITRLFALIFNPFILYKCLSSSLVVVHGTHTPYLLFALLISLFNKRTVLILTDEHGYELRNCANPVKSFLMKLDIFFMRALIHSFDKHICLNSSFAAEFSLSNYVVFPGISSSDVIESAYNYIDSISTDLLPASFSSSYPFVLTFAGNLTSDNGIPLLIKILPFLSDLNVKLNIIGKGALLDLLQKKSSEFSFVTLQQDLSRREILDIMTRSHLLLHPRPTDSPVTRFSFPSKLIEYISTGTPVLSTQLKSIPSDLRPYLNFSLSDSPTSFFNSIVEIYKSSPSEIFSRRISSCDFMKKHYSESAFSRHFLF